MVAGRLAEEELYGQVAQEIAQSILMESLWAKAVAQGNGSMDRAHSIYIKLRVQDLSNNIYIENRKKEIVKEKERAKERAVEAGKEKNVAEGKGGVVTLLAIIFCIIGGFIGFGGFGVTVLVVLWAIVSLLIVFS